MPSVRIKLSRFAKEQRIRLFESPPKVPYNSNMNAVVLAVYVVTTFACCSCALILPATPSGLTAKKFPCGTTTCVAGQHCDAKDNTCLDGCDAAASTAKCVCGTHVCEPGQECMIYGCHTRDCPATGATTVPCTCGYATCSVGKYCYVSGNYDGDLCSDTPLEHCPQLPARIAGTCACGTAGGPVRPCSAGEYCAENQSDCLSKCDGGDVNTSPCVCGTEREPCDRGYVCVGDSCRLPDCPDGQLTAWRCRCGNNICDQYGVCKNGTCT